MIGIKRPLVSAALAMAGALLPVHDARAQAQGAPQDEVVIGTGKNVAPTTDPTATPHATDGNIAVNIASGHGNQELNSVVIAMGDVAIGQAAVIQQTVGLQPQGGATRVAISGDSFSNIDGILGVNIVAGSNNQTANIAAFAVGNYGAMTDQLLAQSRASIEPSRATGEPTHRNDVVLVSHDAFRDNSGLVQVNLIGGEGNSSANTFALSILAEANP